jgi:hypothetical protein
VRQFSVSDGCVSYGVRWQYHCLSDDAAILGEVSETLNGVRMSEQGAWRSCLAVAVETHDNNPGFGEAFRLHPGFAASATVRRHDMFGDDAPGVAPTSMSVTCH